MCSTQSRGIIRARPFNARNGVEAVFIASVGFAQENLLKTLKKQHADQQDHPDVIPFEPTSGRKTAECTCRHVVWRWNLGRARLQNFQSSVRQFPALFLFRHSIKIAG